MATVEVSPTHTANLRLSPDNPGDENINYPDVAINFIVNSYAGYRGTCVFQFDVSAYSGISSALLKIKIDSQTNSGGGVFSMSAYKLTRADWVYNQATWNIYKTANNWTTDGGDYTTSSPSGDTELTPANGNFITLDVTAIVADAVTNNAGIVNILVLSEDNGSPNDINTIGVGDATPANRPYLDLTYAGASSNSNFLMFM